MAPVLKSVLILTSKLLFANIWNTVPVVGPSSFDVGDVYLFCYCCEVVVWVVLFYESGVWVVGAICALNFIY